jgi:hypothetical protein
MKKIFNCVLFGTIIFLFFHFSTSADLQYEAGNSPQVAAVSDINNDLLPDLIVCCREDNCASILVNAGMEKFWLLDRLHVPKMPNQAAVGDINDDSIPDLVISGGEGDINILFGKGDGSFSEPAVYPLRGHFRRTVIEDINNDGKNDIIVSDMGFSPWWGNKVYVMINNGVGEFNSISGYETNSAPHEPALCDINNDGFIDMIISNYGSDDLSVLINNGDGTFIEQSIYNIGNTPQKAIATDIDNDSFSDILVSNQKSNNISVLINRGDGSFFEQVKYETGTYPSRVVTVDIDKDNNNDMVIANYKDNDISIFINNGNGTFADRIDYPTGNGPSEPEISDIDMDSFPDIVESNSTDGNISLFINDKHGKLLPCTFYKAGKGPSKPRCVDINNDKYEDIIVTNYDSGDVSMLINQGNGLFADVHPYINLWFGFDLEPAGNFIYRNSDHISIYLDIITPRSKTKPFLHVDIYFIMVSPNLMIYSGMNWQEGLIPFISDIEVPCGTILSDILLLSFSIPSTKPKVVEPGTYTFAIAALDHDSSELISDVAKVSFEVAQN